MLLSKIVNERLMPDFLWPFLCDPYDVVEFCIAMMGGDN